MNVDKGKLYFDKKKPVSDLYITRLNVYVHNSSGSVVMKKTLLTVTRREVGTQFVSSLAPACVALSDAFRCTIVAVGSASCRRPTHG